MALVEVLAVVLAVVLAASPVPNRVFVLDPVVAVVLVGVEALVEAVVLAETEAFG